MARLGRGPDATNTENVAVVRVDDAAGTLFDQASDGAGIRVLDADMLVGPCDETNVAEIAMLIRAAFEG